MEYVKAVGINYKNELNLIEKKGKNAIQPIFEAFKNSWEAIIEKYGNSKLSYGSILIDLYFTADGVLDLDNIEQSAKFDKIVITDNGCGITDEGYTRLINLRDDSKHHSNQGVGRVQYLHFFKNTSIETVYRNTENKMCKRKLVLSKSSDFLEKNAIVGVNEDRQNITNEDTYTEVVFKHPISIKDEKAYRDIRVEQIKISLITLYLYEFCNRCSDIPKIAIRKFIDGKLFAENKIESADIPHPNKNKVFEILYSSHNKQASFNLNSFVINREILNENILYLIETRGAYKKVLLNDILPNVATENNHYLFLLGGKYIDEHTFNGVIDIKNKKHYKSINDKLFDTEEIIFLDNIKKNVCNIAIELYPDLNIALHKQKQELEDLQKMFLLNPNTIKMIQKNITADDSELSILKKINKAEALQIATMDINLKRHLTTIKSLLPTKKDSYKNKLEKEIDDFIKDIPLQNRTALSRYIARRKIILEIFDNILNHELKKSKNNDRINEAILHNLIFQQSKIAENPNSNDLWLINEEFIYFTGTSELCFNDITYKGEKVFKDFAELKEEDQNYIKANGENRLKKRPDILLFPEENKCIIIELKAPDENVAKHLTQIDFYATMLRNYTKEKFKITRFYGYLIGENIEHRDIVGYVSGFQYSSLFDYWFKPSDEIADFAGNEKGYIYKEVIKYSSLLKRAKLRNKIFIEKLLDIKQK